MRTKGCRIKPIQVWDDQQDRYPQQADPEFERLLAEEEEIERNTRDSGGGADRFRPGDAD